MNREAKNTSVNSVNPGRPVLAEAEEALPQKGLQGWDSVFDE